MSSEDRLKLAGELFKKYRVRCFWSSPDDLVITEDMIPFVVRRLRHYGGREGFLAAEPLREQPETIRSRDAPRNC